jgi:transcription factor SPT20
MAAANSMGAAAGLPAGLQQQQLALSAQQAAAGRIAQGLAGPQQQFLTPQQMQAASMAFLQAQPGATQAVWLKQQQQMPGQALAGVYPTGQTLLGPYPGMPGAQAFNPMAAAGGQPGDGGLPRSSSTGSSAQQQQQQPPPPSASGPHATPGMQQQLMQAGDGQAWQLQQQAAAAAAGGVRPPMAGPQFAMGQPGVPPSPQQMHAAALLFLHDQQQQQQQPQQPPRPDKPQARWWVQRGATSFAGPFTGLQMYQAYLQPTGPLRLTEGTPIAAVAAPAANAAAAGPRDVPPTHTHAFAPLSCLLEAAAQGFVLVSWPSAAGGRRDGQPNALLVQQLQSGVTVPLQNVLSQAGLLALQQQQQHPGVGAGEQPGGEGGSSNEQQMLAAKQRQQQQQQQPQMMSAVRPAAGGYIQLPNGQLVPAAGLVPVQGGGLAMLQANPAAAAAPQPPTVDPLAVANALFTAGGQPNTIVWYIRTDGPTSSEGQQSSSIQGPFDPQVRLRAG